MVDVQDEVELNWKRCKCEAVKSDMTACRVYI